MKKIVALVLALMMVLSLGVSALALTKIDLDQVEVTEDGTKLIKFVDTVEFIGADKVLYFILDNVIESYFLCHNIFYFLYNKSALMRAISSPRRSFFCSLVIMLKDSSRG